MKKFSAHFLVFFMALVCVLGTAQIGSSQSPVVQVLDARGNCLHVLSPSQDSCEDALPRLGHNEVVAAAPVRTYDNETIVDRFEAAVARGEKIPVLFPE